MGFNAMTVPTRVILALTLLGFIFLIPLQLLPVPSTIVKKEEKVDIARTIPAAELLSLGPSHTRGSIPKIFHQSWKSLELPAKFQSWSFSCRQKHRGWDWVLWTDDDNLKLIQKHFPWLEEAYRDLPGAIYQADLARYLYMYTYGGVYADLDTECLQSAEQLQGMQGSLFSQQKVPSPDIAIFGRMGNDPSFEHSIPNAWMVSTPGHKCFLAVLQHFMKLYNETKEGRKDFPLPESLTGPVVLRYALAQYENDKVLNGPNISDVVTKLERNGPFVQSAEQQQIVLLPSHFVYPYSWAEDGKDVRVFCWVLRDTFDAARCKKELNTDVKGSISITYWSHTHSPTGHSTENMKHIA